MTDDQRRHMAAVGAHIKGSSALLRAALDELQAASPEQKTMRHYTLRLALQQALIHVGIAAKEMKGEAHDLE